MKDLRNSEKLYDRYADAVTALVMEQYASAMAESLEAEERAPVEISAELDARCRKSIKKGYAKQLRRSIGKKLLRGAGAAVIAFFLLCGVFAILFSTVDAIRVPIINFFEQKGESFEIPDNDEYEYDREEDVLADLVPEGYEPVECKRSSDGNLTIRYANAGDGTVFYDEFVLTNGTYQTDTEDAVTEDITIGGRDALLIEKEGYKIIWYSASGEVLYQLECNQLSREEIIAIAEEIESRREETLSVDSDNDFAEPDLPEYDSEKYDYVYYDGIPIFYPKTPPMQTPVVTTPSYGTLHIDIQDAVSENVAFSDPYANLDDESEDQLIWSSVDGQETGDDSVDWTVLP